LVEKEEALRVYLHCKKKVREYPVPSRDDTTKLSLGGNNDVITELFLPRGSLVSDIPAGDGKLVNLFLRCVLPRSWSHIDNLSSIEVGGEGGGSQDLPVLPIDWRRKTRRRVSRVG
jgi:hypothetical protein